MHDSFLTYLTQGGPTLWVLIACSLILVALVAERWSKLRALDVDHEWLLSQMSIALRSGDVAQATRICQQAPGCLARVFEAGLYRADHSREEIESAMSTRITQQGQLMEKNMASIGTMAVVAPFIGLFGTVLGIVRSFKELGGANPQAVNAGIAEALASTAAGLFVAILAVVCFNYFKNRVRANVAQLNVSGSQLVEMIVLSRAGRPFPHDLAMGVAPTPAYPAHAYQAHPLSAAPPVQAHPLSPAPPIQGHPQAPPPTHIHPPTHVPDTTSHGAWAAPPPPPYTPPTSWPTPPRDGAVA